MFALLCQHTHTNMTVPLNLPFNVELKRSVAHSVGDIHVGTKKQQNARDVFFVFGRGNVQRRAVTVFS